MGTDEISREKGVITKTFISNFLSADDVKETLTKLGYEDTKIISTKGSNILVVEGSAATMSKVARIIKKLTATPNQVLVESRIMEITAGNNANPSTLGINAKYANSTSTVQTEGFANPAAIGVPGFYAHVVKGNAEAYLQALENKAGFNMLANPKVIAVNEKTASIISGSKLGYKTSITTQTGTIQNVDYLEVGTKLEFTPYISSDGSIKMEIHPEVSEGSVNSDGLPQKNTTEATTTVIVRDGETIIIGGLIKNKSTESYVVVPVVMNLPFIGNFFKNKQILWEKKEIIAMLTPHLITPKILKEMGTEIDRMSQQQRSNGTGESPDVWWWLK
jgi:type II secretory pathway component GspD/PulD (secretin)